MSTIAERIKELRERKDISQRKMADELGVSQVTITYWETGKREPSREMIEKLSKYFEVSPSYLFGWENEHTVFIADNLLKILQLKKMTFEELSNKANIPLFEIQSIITNGRAPTSYISKLGEALDVTMKYLDEFDPEDITPEKLKKQKLLKQKMRTENLLYALNEDGLNEAYRLLNLLNKIPEYRIDSEPHEPTEEK